MPLGGASRAGAPRLMIVGLAFRGSRLPSWTAFRRLLPAAIPCGSAAPLPGATQPQGHLPPRYVDGSRWMAGVKIARFTIYEISDEAKVFAVD